jgi:hypothetical protein
VLTTTRHHRVRVGRVADFCPICRRFEGAALLDVRAIRPLARLWGGGKSVEHVRKCEACGTELPAHLDDYAGTKGGDHLDIESLLGLSQPDVSARWGERLALEEKAMEGQASDPERRTLIAEPFFALDRKLQLRQCEGKVGVGTWCLRLTSLFLLFTGVALGFKTGSIELAAAMGAATIAFWIAAVAAARRAPRAYVRSVIQPSLIRALAPIRPRPEELESVCTELKLDGMELARRVDLSGLVGSLADDDANIRAAA